MNETKIHTLQSTTKPSPYINKYPHSHHQSSSHVSSSDIGSRAINININSGHTAPSRPFANNNKPTTTGYTTLEQLEKSLSLKATARNLVMYIFSDRYSVLFSARIQPSCNYTPRRYDVIDGGSETGVYVYSTHEINNNNNEHVSNYMQVLRQLVGFSSVPNLALMHRTAFHFMIEVISSIGLCGKHSHKNSRDIIFQLIFTLVTIYSLDTYISGLEISIVVLPTPVTLIYKYGSITFTLNEVFVVPILYPRVGSRFRVDVLGPGIENQRKLDSYASIVYSLHTILDNDLVMPAVTDADLLHECLLAYLLLEYTNESNICTFEVTPEDSRMSNKFVGRHCLLNTLPIDRGTVHMNPDNRKTMIRLSPNIFLSTSDGELVELNVDDLDRMLSVKEGNKGKSVKAFALSTVKQSSPSSILSMSMQSASPVDITATSFYTLISDLYSKYVNTIRENIKRIHSTTIRKNTLRIRSLLGTLPIDQVPVSNNVYVELPPVFHIFGLLMPFISRILQVDMYGMFEQLSNLSETKPLSDTETKLIKMSVMNDVKILDLNDMPLTYEQQINILVYLNIFYHVVYNSLIQIGKEYLPKMIEQSLLNHFNSIIETRFKLSCLYDKLNDNDPYHVKVMRKTMLAFGIRPVKLSLRNVPNSYKGGFFPQFSGTTSDGKCTSDDDIEDFIDSITIPHDKISGSDYEVSLSNATNSSAYEYSAVDNSTTHLSIKKFLDSYNRIVTLENRLYWAKFNRAYGFLPVYIGRRDVHKKKEYEQLLVANVECCETRFNTKRVDPRNLFCQVDISHGSGSQNDFNGVQYYPYVLMGIILDNTDESIGTIEDINFTFVNPFVYQNLKPNPIDPDSSSLCPGLVDILKKFDDHFFCASKDPSDKYDCKKSSLSQLLTDPTDIKCCDMDLYKDFKEILTKSNVGLLFVSNKSCLSPIIVSFDQHGAVGGFDANNTYDQEYNDPTYKTSAYNGSLKVGNMDIKVLHIRYLTCLIESSVTSIFYITDIQC